MKVIVQFHIHVSHKFFVRQSGNKLLFGPFDIGSIGYHDSKGFIAISPGSSHFLIIVFDIFGQLNVDHSFHIGFVDAHAKGICGYHDLCLVVEPQFHVFFLLFVRKASMIISAFKTQLIEVLCGFNTRSSVAHINDGRLRIFCKNLLDFIIFIFGNNYMVGQIFSNKRFGKKSGVMER